MLPCKTLQASDEVVVEATGNTMAVVRVLSPFVARVVVANPLQVRAIAHAHIKTDKIDAGVLASLHAAGFLSEADMQTLHRARERLVGERTALINQPSTILLERGIVIAQVRRNLERGLDAICAKRTVSQSAHDCAS
jgi:transposase